MRPPGGASEAASLTCKGQNREPQPFGDIAGAALGGPLDDGVRREIAEAIGDAIEPIEDARGSVRYRRHVTSVLVRRALERVSI